jgi:biopolymer transport protein ExbB/TolQ
VILAHLANFAHANVTSLAMFQDAAPEVGFSPMQLWGNMGNFARAIVIVLFIMSVWSLAVIIDRWLYFSAARKQSREFAPKVAGALKEGRLDEAIKVADRSKKSHLAEVVTAGLTEFRSFGSGGAITEEQVESSKRALERSESIVHAKLKKGLGGLATIGATAPFVGLLGTVMGILNAFQKIATTKSQGLSAVAGGISEALVMTFNYFTNKVEAFDVEMDNSSSELVDYFIKQGHR